MTRGSKKFLLKTFKWVFVPLGLIVAGYLVVGPLASDYLNEVGFGAQTTETAR